MDKIINRTTPPKAWNEGDNIPWHDPEFSKRMLKEHLSQDHDAASRRFELVKKQVEWIETSLLENRKSKVLDLCCGPGLYANLLARNGHECVGVDYSPASIEYAIGEAQKGGLGINYICEDIRKADYGDGYDLILMIYGEFNVFHSDKVKTILEKSLAALKPGGMILCDVHTYEAINKIGLEPPSWFSSESGLFSTGPHIVLSDSYFDGAENCSTKRFYLMDKDSDKVTKYGVSYQAYTDDEYILLFESCGFNNIEIMKYPDQFKDAEGIGLQFVFGKKQGKELIDD